MMSRSGCCKAGKLPRELLKPPADGSLSRYHGRTQPTGPASIMLGMDGRGAAGASRIQNPVPAWAASLIDRWADAVRLVDGAVFAGSEKAPGWSMRRQGGRCSRRSRAGSAPPVHPEDPSAHLSEIT